MMLKAPGKSKSDGRTGTQILLEAMSKDKVHLARFVLDALDGGIVDSRTEGAQTPLISSVLLPDTKTRCKFVELLLQRGANVNCRDGNGRTALSHACEKGCVDAVKVLVRNNADPEVVDAWGNSALMYAAAAGHSPVVEFLVRAFKRLGLLQIDRRNKVGNSAAGVAKLLGHAECVFALTHNSKKCREREGGARGDTAPWVSSGCGDVNDKPERRVGRLADPHTCSPADCLLVQHCTWQPRPRVQQGRLPSMDSIDELEREHDGTSSPPQVVFSEILTPKPPPRMSHHLPNSKLPEIPPLKQSYEAPKSIFFSPRPLRNTPKPSPPSVLGVLLAPILEPEANTGRSKRLDFGLRRFHEKRCSLPTSVLSPAPRDHMVSVRKTRTVRRREESPCEAERVPFTAEPPTTTFSALSNKLLRRFTSPELKRDPKELEEDGMWTSGRIPRSETFPRGLRHPQVGSKPSIDSISSVKCEFGVLK